MSTTATLARSFQKISYYRIYAYLVIGHLHLSHIRTKTLSLALKPSLSAPRTRCHDITNVTRAALSRCERKKKKHGLPRGWAFPLPTQASATSCTHELPNSLLAKV